MTRLNRRLWKQFQHFQVSNHCSPFFPKIPCYIKSMVWECPNLGNVTRFWDLGEGEWWLTWWCDATSKSLSHDIWAEIYMVIFNQFWLILIPWNILPLFFNHIYTILLQGFHFLILIMLMIFKLVKCVPYVMW